MPILRCIVQDAAAVFAAHDFLPRFHAMRGLGGHFHVAAGANFVFERDNNSVAFAFEETFEPAQ
jgi:hypothetical protein